MASRLIRIVAITVISAAVIGGATVMVRSFMASTSAATTAAQAAVELGPEALARGPSAVILGNPKGDVTVVEYFDYQCPVCRRVHPFVKQLAAEDEGVRIVHKHWPMFGAASIYASRLALAARWQDRYELVHDAIMAIPGRLDEARIREAASMAGLDLVRAEQDLAERSEEITAAFADATAQARILQLRGTPGFVIGNYLVPGGLDLQAMKEIVGDVRADRQKGEQG